MTDENVVPGKRDSYYLGSLHRQAAGPAWLPGRGLLTPAVLREARIPVVCFFFFIPADDDGAGGLGARQSRRSGTQADWGSAILGAWFPTGTVGVSV